MAEPLSPGGNDARDALNRLVPSLVEGMRMDTNNEEQQVECLLQLAQIVDTSFGQRAVLLCETICETDGVARLAALCGHPREWLHQTAMLVLGNLAADSVDVQTLFKEAEGFELLMPRRTPPRSCR